MADDYAINLNNELWATVDASDKLRGEVDAPYRFYFDDYLLPITPSKWNYEAKNQNEVLHMANGDEVTWIKQSGLATWQFDFTISNPKLMEESYEFFEGLRSPDFMIDYLNKVKNQKKTIQFIVTDGLFESIVNEKVTLEDWNVEQDSENCNDYVFSVTLQEYKEWHNMEADVDLNHHLILAKYAKGWRT